VHVRHFDGLPCAVQQLALHCRVGLLCPQLRHATVSNSRPCSVVDCSCLPAQSSQGRRGHVCGWGMRTHRQHAIGGVIQVEGTVMAWGCMNMQARLTKVLVLVA